MLIHIIMHVVGESDVLWFFPPKMALVSFQLCDLWVPWLLLMGCHWNWGMLCLQSMQTDVAVADELVSGGGHLQK